MIENIRWLGHGSFLIQGPPFIYIDPWRVVRNAFLADLILISHHHYDHFSIADINKLRGPDTAIIGNARVAEQLEEVHMLREWQTISFDRLSIKAVPAYSPQGKHHAREMGGLGFVISMNYYDIFYAGDTKLTPDIQRIRPDIAIVPIDGNDTMDVQEAAEFVKLIRPRWVLPSNWGTTGEGATRVEANLFKRAVGDAATVIIPEIDAK